MPQGAQRFEQAIFALLIRFGAPDAKSVVPAVQLVSELDACPRGKDVSKRRSLVRSSLQCYQAAVPALSPGADCCSPL